MSLRHLFRFPGGVRLPHWKPLSDQQPLASVPVPAVLIIPLHPAGVPVRPLVAEGDRVRKGDLLAAPLGPRGTPIHAGSSGVIAALEQRQLPDGGQALCAVLQTDGLDAWSDTHYAAIPGPATASPAELLERVRACGVAGLGGAGFPTATKLDAALAAGARQLIINGVECEPCITCDDRLLRERAADVVSGIRILQRILGAEHTLVALENDRTQARAALEQALGEREDGSLEVVSVPVIYPAGGERQLIQTLTGREVPAGGLPIDIGMVCQNVGTAAAVHRAVMLGEPLISRIVTVTGAGVRAPCNLEVRLGTPVGDVIRAAGGYTEHANRLIMGGPMMGIGLAHDDFPVMPATDCLLIGEPHMLPDAGPQMPCIRCGACADVCPASLLPQQLHWHGRSRDLNGLRDHQLFACIECGACDYVCPSHIPLVSGFREGKAAIRQQDRERQRAELARERYLFRQQRLEQEQRQMEERRRRKKEALRQRPADSAAGGTVSGAADPRKAAIQAAIERARRKKTETPGGPADDD